MDDALELLELFVDSGADSVLIWLFRLLGLIAILAGVGLWLLADIGTLVPAVLVVVGLLLLTVPELLFGLLELV